jgi:hypothetical protein
LFYILSFQQRQFFLPEELFFGGTGVSIQGLLLAKQAVYLMSHTSSSPREILSKTSLLGHCRGGQHNISK